EGVDLEELVEHLLVGVAQRAQQHADRQLAAAVDAGEQRVLRVELEVQPGAAVRDDAGAVQQLARRMGLAAVVVEEHAGRTVQLRDDDALGAVDDEGAVLGHERDLAHVDLLLLHVLDGLARRLAVVDHQAHGHAQRGAVAEAAVAALALVEHRLAELVADVLQRCVAVVADDREHGLEGGVQAAVGALGRVHVLLEEIPVRIDLDRQQEGNFENGPALAEVLADALLLGERVGGGSRGHGVDASLATGRASAVPGGSLLDQVNRQSGVAGIAGTSTPSPATSDCRLASFFIAASMERPKAGGFRPRPRLHRHAAGDAIGAYLTSTVAPAASRSFFIFSASSFEAPSFTVPPASVRSLASFRPRPVMARTALMTSTFLSPADFRTTVNSVCSSAAAPAAAAGPAAITGAAAETPNFSSMAFTSSITSISDLAAMASTICSLDRDIVFTSGKLESVG